MSRKDKRPVCTCTAYDFPHKIGGKCTGSQFAENYFYYQSQLCRMCNCNHNGECDVLNGAESIYNGECYMDVIASGDRHLHFVEVL